MENILFDFISKYMPLSDEEKQVIIDLDIFSIVKKGTILLKEGQMSNKSFFVLKGCLRIYYIIDGEEKTTAFYTEMEGISPHCAINKKPSDYYISCVEDSIIVASDTEMETTGFEKFPRFETLCRIMSEQLLAKSQMIFDEYKTSTPEQRYLNLLKTRPDLLQRVPQYQLASFLGITPQSLSRLRARIVDKRTE
ncbi:MAG: Crp/Fnr family transcriptional regulator [Dysgonamonadaceae bacterium]|jgi:CRP-like cAMP-binding protein|nr:Crp/Fnr family transcriptional regulator [Dysgonamonadaceae bacterium]